ncbi:MAG TPA: FecR domain-containing protein [Planctomycetota bacterium]|nr:FecR domain-containing protein [Planctomycetota bacterium]
MDVTREDLVAFALGGLPPEDQPRVAGAIAADKDLARELREIERHLRLHDAAPAIEPPPALWASIRERIEGAPAPARSPWQRFRLPLAAAALIVAALFWPDRGPGLTSVHGHVIEREPGVFEATDVARVVTPDGVTITMDAGTTIRLLPDKRLALGAGRVFLEVPPGRSGFAVVAGDLVAQTMGTAFLVERGEPAFVWTESGHVRCAWRDREAVAGPGEAFFASAAPPPPLPPSPRSWFRRPTLEARTMDASSIRVTLRNDMPDPIDVAPSKAGEPLFFASYGGHDFPLAPDDFRPQPLAPGARWTFDLRLPRPVTDGEALFVSYPRGGVRAEARR